MAYDVKNIRVAGEDSPEARLAAVCVETCRRVKSLTGRPPDYADFRDDIRKFVRLEILLARLEEARVPYTQRAARLADILNAIVELDIQE